MEAQELRRYFTDGTQFDVVRVRYYEREKLEHPLAYTALNGMQVVPIFVACESDCMDMSDRHPLWYDVRKPREGWTEITEKEGEPFVYNKKRPPVEQAKTAEEIAKEREAYIIG